MTKVSKLVVIVACAIAISGTRLSILHQSGSIPLASGGSPLASGGGSQPSGDVPVLLCGSAARLVRARLFLAPYPAPPDTRLALNSGVLSRAGDGTSKPGVGSSCFDNGLVMLENSPV